MSSKNPFEIRLDLLHLAFGILSDQRTNEREFVRENIRVKENLASSQSMSDNYKVELLKVVEQLSKIKSPSTYEILAEAEKLNEFVSKDTKYNDPK